MGKGRQAGRLRHSAPTCTLTPEGGRAKYAPLAETTGEDVALAERLLTSS